MALMTWTYDGTITRDAGSTTSYSRFDLDWSGLPGNIRITRCYWQWTVSREKGATYARWYEYGNSDNKGNTGTSGTFTFDVALVTGNSGTARVYLGSQNGKSIYTNVSFNVEFEYLQSSFTLSTTNVEAGKAITANIAIQDPTATHKATWQFGTRTTTTTTGAGVTVNSFTVPLAWLDQIPNATSGLASCTLETINSAGTSVGSQVLYFNILAPASVVPIITSLTAARVNNSVPSAWGVYVQGQSGVTVQGVGAGAYGSTITGWVITGDGKKASADTLSIAKLSGSGTLTFKATVTDSRGRTATATVSIEVLAWTSPTVKTLAATRANADGTDNPIGTSILVSLDAVIASVNDLNTRAVVISYRLQGASGWTQAVSASVASGSWVIAADAAAETSAYEVQVMLSDAFSSVTAVTLVATAECYIDKVPGRRRLGIGGYNAKDNSVYINPEWAVNWGEKHLTPTPRNLLDNSDFPLPHVVNQRGNAVYTGNRFTVDRWFLSSTSAGTSGYDVGGQMRLAPAYAQFIQRLENYHAGEKLTFAMYFSAVDNSDSQLIMIVNDGKTQSAATVKQGLVVVKHTVTTSPTQLMVGLQNNNQTTMRSCTPVWAALYEGEYTADTLPEYVPKGYAAELAECQRYYENSYSVLGLASKNEYIGVAINSTMLDCLVPFGAPKRVSPTITLHPVSPASGWRTYNDSAYCMLGTVTPQVARDTAGFNVRGTKAADDATTWATGRAMPVLGHWEASADL